MKRIILINIFVALLSCIVPTVNAGRLSYSSSKDTVKTFLDLWKTGNYFKMIEALNSPYCTGSRIPYRNENIASFLSGAEFKSIPVNKGHPYNSPIGYKIILEQSSKFYKHPKYCVGVFTKEGDMKIRVLVTWGWTTDFKGGETTWKKHEWKEYHDYYVRSFLDGWKIVAIKIEEFTP